jgi:hypothetical protein
MAGTTTTSKDTFGHDGAGSRDLMLQHQKVVDDLEALRTKVNAIVTAAATSVAAINALGAAGAITTAKIGGTTGTPITS